MFLSPWAIQKQGSSWIWPPDLSLLVPVLEAGNLVKNKPEKNSCPRGASGENTDNQQNKSQVYDTYELVIGANENSKVRQGELTCIGPEF